jgi:hypothetical protein
LFFGFVFRCETCWEKEKNAVPICCGDEEEGEQPWVMCEECLVVNRKKNCCDSLI